MKSYARYKLNKQCEYEQPNGYDLRHLQSFVVVVVHLLQSERSHNSRSVLHWTTTFCTDIQTDLVHSHTRYDIIIYFRPACIMKNRWKCHLRRRWVQFAREWFNQGSPNFSALLTVNSFITLPNVTSIAAPRRLQNVIEYCITVSETDPGKRVE